jgi:hypothetical protein
LRPDGVDPRVDRGEMDMAAIEDLAREVGMEVVEQTRPIEGALITVRMPGENY